MQELEIVKLLRLDFGLIDDAVRRLLEGTFRLEDSDEQASAHHLYNKTTTALEEHFKIEEDTIFPLLQQAFAKRLAPGYIEKMRAEHGYLRELVHAVKLELEHQHAIAFRAVLREFLEVLHQHTILENAIPYHEVVGQIDQSYLKSVIGRIGHGYVD